jgi:hypothetical protein
MVRRQPKKDRRIDAAIDHFVPMGFKKMDIRNIVNSLLKVRLFSSSLSLFASPPRHIGRTECEGFLFGPRTSGTLLVKRSTFCRGNWFCNLQEPFCRGFTDRFGSCC